MQMYSMDNSCSRIRSRCDTLAIKQHKASQTNIQRADNAINMQGKPVPRNVSKKGQYLICTLESTITFVKKACLTDTFGEGGG